MVKILKNTPFGFVMELQNEMAYFSEYEYEVYVDHKLQGVYEKNVISIFGLHPGTTYHIRIQETGRENLAVDDPVHEPILFELRTKDIMYIVNIYDYNAAGDGEKDDTSAINTAIYAAPEGAVVYIPKGSYLVNQIYLKSGVDIYLEKGSYIRQNTDRDSLSIIKGYQKDYHHKDATVNASWEGNPLDTYCGIFFGYRVEQVNVYGEGVIDGSGEEGGWWFYAKEKKGAFRPKNIFLNQCRHITFSGIKSRNSACWNIHPFYCQEISFYDVSLKSKKESPNTDGINPESCSKVQIIGCRFDVGDDCIAIKSGKYFMSQFRYQPCEDIYISNCYLGNGHGGIAIGSEISCGVRNLTVEKCYMDGTDRGIRIKTRRGRGKGSILNNIKLMDIVMKNVQHCVGINMFYNCDPDGRSDYVKNKNTVEKDELTPEIRNVVISNIDAEDIRGCAIFMYGLPESKIDQVEIRNSTFRFSSRREDGQPEMLEDFEIIPDLGIFIKNVDNVTLRDNKFTGKYVSIMEEETKSERN